MKSLLHIYIFLSLFFTVFVYANGLPAPQDDREFFVDENKLPFDRLPLTNTQTFWGVLNGAGFRAELPDNWNGDLVMWAHGYSGTGAELEVSVPPLRKYLIDKGYAWAASSYTKNYYDVRSGVQSTNELANYFRENIANPQRIFIAGASMGGHVVGVAIEQPPSVNGGIKYSGALPVCGVMGDVEHGKQQVDFRLVAEQLAGLPNQFPTVPDYENAVVPIIKSELYTNYPFRLSSKGEKLKSYLLEVTGGKRPTFNQGFVLYQEFLFNRGLGNGSMDGVIGGNIFDNLDRIYQLDADPILTAEEQALNDSMLRVERNPLADPPQDVILERLPNITGRIDIPVLTLHTLGDLIVPFSMQQIYARRVAANGRSEYLVQRAIRDTIHCNFRNEELTEAFDELIKWVNEGVRPVGDNVLDPTVVADPNYGCQFTTSRRWPLPRCQ